MDDRLHGLLLQLSMATIALLRRETHKYKRRPQDEFNELVKAEQKLGEAIQAFSDRSCRSMVDVDMELLSATRDQKPWETPPVPFPKGGGLLGATARQIAEDFDRSQSQRQTADRTESISPLLPQPQRILTVLARHYPGGLTCEEIERETGIARNTVSARMGELSLQERVHVDTRGKRRTSGGVQAQVWVKGPRS